MKKWMIWAIVVVVLVGAGTGLYIWKKKKQGGQNQPKKGTGLNPPKE